jgi:hypothetical protein
MNVSKPTWFLYILCLLAAAGCGQRNTARATPRVESIPLTLSATPTPAPETPSQVYASATQTALPYPGPRSSTPSPTAPFPSSTPAPAFTATLTPPGMALFRQTAVFSGGQSTNGQWLFQIESGPNGYWITHLVRKDASQEWSLQFDPQEVPPGNFDQVYLVPVFWLPKEPYVFLSGVYSGKCGWEVFTLKRLNLKNGALTSVIPGSVCKPVSFSFSHTGRYLLRALPGLGQVQLQRLSDGAQTFVNIPFHFDSSQSMSWSPDETRLVLDLCQVQADAPGLCAARPLVWIDAENGVFHRLLPDLSALQQDNADYWGEIFWLSANRISIHMQSGLTWEVSLVTGQAACRNAHGGVCPARNESASTPTP